jgi:hypothetical protein
MMGSLEPSPRPRTLILAVPWKWLARSSAAISAGLILGDLIGEGKMSSGHALRIVIISIAATVLVAVVVRLWNMDKS